MRKVSYSNLQDANVRDWPIVLTAATGLFLSTLDTGIINVALPTLDRTFHVSISTGSWTVTLYLLLLSITIVLFGRTSDRIGRVKVFSLGLAVFGIASILCGASMTISQLIVFRGIQGIGAAMLQATATAIITTAISENRRGAALGTLGMMLGLGPVLGPSVGGILLSFVGWRWIFWINVPICMLGLLGCSRLPKAGSGHRRRTSLDVTGNVLLGLAIIGLLSGLSANSFTSSLPFGRVLSFCVSAAALVGYSVHESRISEPIVNLSLLRTRYFVVPIFAVTVLGLATAVVFIVPPYFLEQVSKIPPWEAGLVNLAAPLGLVIMSKISGKRIGRYGTTRLMGAGLSIMFVSLMALCAIQSNWSVPPLVGLLLVYGIGAGIFVPPNLSAIMGTVSQDAQGTIGAVQRMVQNIGIAVGTSVPATLIHAHSNAGLTGLITAFRDAWGFAAAMVLVSFITVFYLSVRSRLRLK